MSRRVICWSGGKDSTATVILAHLHNIPVDEIIFSEVRYSPTISGEYPEHLAFIYRAKKVFETWGFKVSILHTNETYLHCFYKRFKRSKVPARVGTFYGFPIRGKCIINSRCKVKPMRRYLARFDDVQQYVGIGIDEPERLARLNDSCVSLLAKCGMTTADAKQLCSEYDLLSPLYKIGKRGGCWFCPNSSKTEISFLYSRHYDLFRRIVNLENEPNTIFNKWHYDKSIIDFVQI